jgi:hypothetical protein
MVRSQKRNSCTRTADGKRRSIKAIRNQAKRMGLKASGSRKQICDRITAKQRRRSKSNPRRRSKSNTRRRSLKSIDCKQYNELEKCRAQPNCNWLGGALNRCQARAGVRQGRLHKVSLSELSRRSRIPVDMKSPSRNEIKEAIESLKPVQRRPANMVSPSRDELAEAIKSLKPIPQKNLEEEEPKEEEERAGLFSFMLG